MAVDKGKVKAALDAKFKGKSVSKELKEALAARWADKIDDEAGIDDYISEREEDVLDAAKEADRRATTAAAKARQEAADAAAGKKTETETPKDELLTDDTPAWAKSLLKKNEELVAKVEGFERSRNAETLAERFKKDARLKGVPDFLLKRAIPQKEEDFEDAVTELATEYQAFAEQNKLAGFGGDTPPGGGQKGGSNAGKVDADIAAYAQNKVAALTKQN